MNNRKLKILIITHYFPPLNGIPSWRPYSWAKYWSKWGHDICVLTTKKESFDGLLSEISSLKNISFNLEEVPYWPFKNSPINKVLKELDNTTLSYPILNLARIIRIFKDNPGGSFPNRHDLWIIPAILRALNIYKKWPFELMVSTYGPPASHIIGGMLKNILKKVFWVADYRDLWSNNYLYNNVKLPFSLIDKWIENFFVKNANLITTVSKPLLEKLSLRFRKSKFLTIENGFDLDDLEELDEKNIFPLDGKIRFVYTGTIYAGKRDPSPLFQALNILKLQGFDIEKKIEILFYGFNLGNLYKLIQRYNLTSIVKTHTFVDRRTCLQIQRAADALIFLEWADQSESGILTGKIFEYMWSKRPILGIGGGSNTIVGNLIESAGVGFACGKSVDKIVSILKFFLNGEKIPYSPAKEILCQYTRETLAQKLLKKMIAYYEIWKDEFGIVT